MSHHVQRISNPWAQTCHTWEISTSHSPKAHPTPKSHPKKHGFFGCDFFYLLFPVPAPPFEHSPPLCKLILQLLVVHLTNESQLTNLKSPSLARTRARALQEFLYFHFHNLHIQPSQQTIPQWVRPTFRTYFNNSNNHMHFSLLKAFKNVYPNPLSLTTSASSKRSQKT